MASHPLRRGGPRLKIIGIKTFLDGGMLTGSAYMREPWGVSKIYAIDDPSYRGVLFIPPERLRAIVRETVAAGLAVHGPQRRRRRGSRLARRLRGDQQDDTRRPDAAVHHAFQFHEPRGDRTGRAAGRGGRHSAGLALPRYAHARRPFRVRPPALLSAAAQPVRSRA